MPTKLKYALWRIVAMLFVLAGTFGAFGLSGLVFDESYMQTQRALGVPGATTQLWIGFTLCVAVALAGLAVLLLSFRRGKRPTVTQ